MKNSKAKNVADKLNKFIGDENLRGLLACFDSEGNAIVLLADMSQSEELILLSRLIIDVCKRKGEQPNNLLSEISTMIKYLTHMNAEA